VAQIGRTLREARLGRGLTIEQVAQDTRISARFLEALEDEDFGALPAPVYVRGFLRSYANYLRVDAQPLLAALDEGTGRRVAGPDGFVGGPSAPRPRSADPFRRAPAAPPQPPTVPGEMDVEDDEFDEGDAEATYGPGARGVQPLPRGRGVVPAAEFEEQPLRPRRVAGVLTGRPDDYGGGGSGSSRILLIAGGGMLVLLLVLAVAVFATRGGDDSSSNAAAPLPTSTPRAGTVITVGSATPKPSVTGTPGASTTPTGTPATATPTVGAGTPTPTRQPEAPTATPEATATPETTPSVTAVPTATSTPPPTPKPIPTPLPPHPYQYEECTGGSCGDPPFRVVCVPDGSWFVDVKTVGGVFQVPSDWYVVSVNSTKQLPTACGG
jgi:cytoskeleton protein RodZ